MKQQNEVFAAIALAMHEHFAGNAHDYEPGVITIAQRQTMWNIPTLAMTRRPRH